MQIKCGKYEVAAILLLGINMLIGIIMYFVLQDNIAIQWNGSEISTTVGKIYILLFPLISLLFLGVGKTLLRRVSYKWFKKSNEKIISYSYMFLQIMFLTCQLYIVLFAYGLRLTISAILIIELIIGVIRGLKLR